MCLLFAEIISIISNCLILVSFFQFGPWIFFPFVLFSLLMFKVDFPQSFPHFSWAPALPLGFSLPRQRISLSLLTVPCPQHPSSPCSLCFCGYSTFSSSCRASPIYWTFQTNICSWTLHVSQFSLSSELACP